MVGNEKREIEAMQRLAAMENNPAQEAAKNASRPNLA